MTLWSAGALRVTRAALVIALALGSTALAFRSEAQMPQVTDRMAVMEQLVRDLYDRLSYLDSQLAAAKVFIEQQQKALRAANVSVMGPAK